ncbi:hypothetical protein NPIL_193491 [Nephila pilipes]|uniref:Uncharacterized protein n=1 Tax=Nephila pilipes TaxID=299642 RepID=A0A8X6U3J9_NEPPI|nr:hypothetical protein NPIL_193491 [Nephila pilipes]
MCGGLYDLEFQIGWLSLSGLEKSTVSVELNPQCNSNAFSPWNTEANVLDSLLGNFSHIFSEDRYDVSCVKLEPEKVVLTSELPVFLHPYCTSPQNSIEIET